MKQCLACWEDIEDDELICHHCGSNQEEVKDYLALVVLKQRKKKIEVPEETPVLDYIFEVDPEVQNDISVGKGLPKKRQQPFAPIAPTTSHPSESGQYQPDKPSWLGTPVATEKQPSTEEKPSVNKTPPSKKPSKAKSIVCPECNKEVPMLKYCKFCGQRLQKECVHCGKIISIRAKFCTGCGKAIK